MRLEVGSETLSRLSRAIQRVVISENASRGRAIHFVGFRGDEFWSAVKIWGRPGFIHRGWDPRARSEIADGDIVIFATGEHNQPGRERNFQDIDEGVAR